MSRHNYHPNSYIPTSNQSHSRSNHINNYTSITPANVNNKETALLQLMDRTGYNVVQVNGQRKYGPPPDWVGNAPSKGCEIFIGKIPRDCYEDELVPIFERIGKIYELRLMMDFSGTNRGYAFLMFTKVDHAHRAIREFNNLEIRPGKKIGVVKSLDNCRLFVGGIPKNKTKQDIVDEMSKITDGVVDAIVYSCLIANGQSNQSGRENPRNRGFAFVEYENHRAAAMARRKLLPGKIQLWGHDIAVDWADPEPEVDEETMSKVTNLYVRNLSLDTTEEQIREIFSLGPMNLQIERVKKIKDYAFVHYVTREQAEKALQFLAKMNLNHLASEGHQLEVTWAKPPNANRERKRHHKQRNEMMYGAVNASNVTTNMQTHAHQHASMMQHTSPQTPVMSPAYGPMMFRHGPISPSYHTHHQYEYPNYLPSPRPPTTPYMPNYTDLNNYLSPQSQYLFRGVSLVAH